MSKSKPNDERVPSPAPTAKYPMPELADVLCNACQLLDSVKADWDQEGCWSEWDQAVRDGLSRELKKVYESAASPPPDQAAPDAAELAREIAAKSWDNEEEAAVWIEALLRTHLGESRWIPVSERLPEENVRVLIKYKEFDPKGFHYVARFGEICLGHWRPEGGNGNFDDHVSAWMPSPPAEEK